MIQCKFSVVHAVVYMYGINLIIHQIFDRDGQSYLSLKPLSDSTPTFTISSSLCMKTKVLCTCALCRRHICVYKGEETPGRAVVSRTRNKHLLREELRNLSTEQVEEAVSSTIILSAAPLSRQGSGTLPIRRRDSQRDREERGEGIEADSVNASYLTKRPILSTTQVRSPGRSARHNAPRE